jgi:hypothetical protein
MSLDTTFEAMANMRRAHTLMNHELGEYQVAIQQGQREAAEECRQRAHAAMDSLCDAYFAAHTGQQIDQR